jgi:hypothetical protein
MPVHTTSHTQTNTQQLKQLQDQPICHVQAISPAPLLAGEPTTDMETGAERPRPTLPPIETWVGQQAYVSSTPTAGSSSSSRRRRRSSNLEKQLELASLSPRRATAGGDVSGSPPRPDATRRRSASVTFAASGSPSGAGSLLTLSPPRSPHHGFSRKSHSVDIDYYHSTLSSPRLSPLSRTPRATTPLRPANLGLSPDAVARRHRLSASLGLFEDASVALRPLASVSPLLAPPLSQQRTLSPRPLPSTSSRCNSSPDPPRLSAVREPTDGTVDDDDEDDDDDDDDDDDGVPEGETVYDWCAVDTTERTSGCPAPSASFLGSSPPPLAERPHYRPPAIRCGLTS